MNIRDFLLSAPSQKRHKRNLLENVELGLLVVFVIVSFIALIFDEIIWAAIPLIPLMGLNIYNRYRLDRLTRQSLARVSKVKDFIEKQVEELKIAMQNLNQNAPNPQQTEGIEHLVLAMQNLQPQLDFLEQSIAPMKEQLATLTQQFNEQNQVQQQESLRDAITSLSNANAQLSQRIAKLHQRLNQLPPSPQTPVINLDSNFSLENSLVTASENLPVELIETQLINGNNTQNGASDINAEVENSPELSQAAIEHQSPELIETRLINR